MKWISGCIDNNVRVGSVVKVPVTNSHITARSQNELVLVTQADVHSVDAMLRRLSSDNTTPTSAASVMQLAVKTTTKLAAILRMQMTTYNQTLSSPCPLLSAYDSTVPPPLCGRPLRMSRSWSCDALNFWK